MNEQLELTKLSLSNLDQINNIKNNPVVKATILSVLNAVPVIGALIDGSIDVILNEFQSKKRNELIELIISDRTITTDMVSDVEFIVNFGRTLEAVNKLATNDKVKYFANLLKNSYFTDSKIDNNDFEEFFDCINSLSYRQIAILSTLYKIEKNPGPYIDKNISEKEHIVSRYWESFERELEDKLGIKQDEVFPIMKSIERTGLFTIYNGFSFGTVNFGTLTPYFRKFAARVLELNYE